MREKRLKNTDWAVIIISLILFAIGLVALYSATQSTELSEFKKQIQWFLISIPFIILVYIIDYRMIVKLSPVLYLILMALLIGVLFTEAINGAKSWFQIGDFLSFQPSELGKIIIIMFSSLILYNLQLKGKKEINKPWKLVLFIISWAIPMGLILLQPDIGTCAAYAIAMVFMIFVSGLDKKYIIFAIVLVIALAPVVYNNLPAHALSRIEVFLNPESDPRGAGYNIIQSKLAIGAGQFFGMGLLQGNQTQLRIFISKNDRFYICGNW